MKYLYYPHYILDMLQGINIVYDTRYYSEQTTKRERFMKRKVFHQNHPLTWNKTVYGDIWTIFKGSISGESLENGPPCIVYDTIRCVSLMRIRGFGRLWCLFRQIFWCRTRAHIPNSTSFNFTMGNRFRKASVTDASARFIFIVYLYDLVQL